MSACTVVADPPILALLDDVLGTHWDIASQSIERWDVHAG